MNQEFDYEFTVENLYLLGMYEELYEMFLEYQRIGEEIYEIRGCFNFSEQYDCCDLTRYSQYKKKYGKNVRRIKGYLNNHSYYFCKNYKIHINDQMMGTILYCAMHSNFSRSQGGFKLVKGTFQKFLSKIQFVICSRLLKIYQNISVTPQPQQHEDGTVTFVNVDYTYKTLNDTFLEVNQNIREAVKNQYFCNTSENELFRYDLTSDSKTIFVYTNLHNLVCNQKQHHIVPKVVAVRSLINQNTVKLPINHCLTCDEYYIGKNSLSILQGKFGLLLIKSKICTPEQCSDIEYLNFNAESELHSYGYNVIAGELTTEERRNLLSYLIDNKIMSVFEIRRDLEKAINIFKNRHTHANAEMAWLDDLAFVDNYKISNTKTEVAVV